MEIALKLQALRGCLAPVETRPKLSELLRVEIDGTRWVAATNGHIALAFPAEPELEAAAIEPEPEFKLQNLTTVLGALGSECPTVELEELRQWAHSLPGEIPEHFARGDIRATKCDRCDARRYVECVECDGTGTQDVNEYDEDDCFECDGEGSVPCPRCHPESDGSEGSFRHGWLGDVMLNRTLLYRVVRILPAGPVRVKAVQPDRPIQLETATWRAVVMPLRQGGDWDREEREAPVFEPLRTAASAHGWRRSA